MSNNDGKKVKRMPILLTRIDDRLIHARLLSAGRRR